MNFELQRVAGWLAEACPQVDGAWLTAFVVAVLGAVGSVLAKRSGKAEGMRDKVTLENPVPEIPIKRVYSPPTYHQHQELERRMEKVEVDMVAIRRELSEQFKELLISNEARSERLMTRLDQVAREIHGRVDDFIRATSAPGFDSHLQNAAKARRQQGDANK